MEMARVRNLRLICLFLMDAGFAMFRRFGVVLNSLSMTIDRISPTSSDCFTSSRN
jgi:hypothetical protein